LCGIAGIYRFDGQPIDRQVVKKMGDAIAHRGPDDDRYYFWSPGAGNELHRHTITAGHDQPILGFAHRRLSIVDISGGHQPMPNEDSSAWISYNGEIYNHLDLRAPLLQKGHRFQTQSDTEAVLHLYEEYGPAAVSQLNGIFAFAL